jgi:uncharacterized membrane protein YqjE
MAEERSISTILQDVLGDVSEIVRSEIKLAKTEVTAEANQIVRTLPIIGVGALFAVGAFGLALTAGVLAFGLIVPYWAAALILFGLTVIVAAVCIGFGIARLKSVRLKPVKTIQTLEENAQWLKTQTH